MAEEEALGALRRAVDDPDAGDEVNDVVRRSSEQIVAALMSTVAVHPFQA